ncbi:hypothetical protein BGZ98_002045 [Dissophora globulifera]|nr:hypothetical protein BGZ98_002045 [Dissophora globulifera]
MAHSSNPQHSPIKVFFLGATGYIGSTLLDFLLSKQFATSYYSIRALVRTPEKADRARSVNIVPVLGTLDDADLLTREAAEADVVISAASADHLASVQAILKGLMQQPRAEGGRRRPILIHTSGAGVVLDQAYGSFSSNTIYHDNDRVQLDSLNPSQPHRNVDLLVLSPLLKGKVDTYIVVPPTIWGFGTGIGNHNSIQIPWHIAASLKNKQALQIGQGLNYWSKVHVIDLAHFYVSLLERALEEPQDDEIDTGTISLPKNEDAYYFLHEGDDFTYGEVAQEIANVFKRLGINESGEVMSTAREEEAKYWPPQSGALLGGNSRVRGEKAREIFRWEPMYTDFKGYIMEDIQRQRQQTE